MIQSKQILLESEVHVEAEEQANHKVWNEALWLVY